jgi:hypothetical protein
MQRDVPLFSPPPRRWWRNDIAQNSPVPASGSRVRLIAGARALRAASEHDTKSALAERFHTLAERWRAETEFASSPSSMFMNAAYQEIIGMGRDALPFILKDLAETRSHWFWALRAITGVDPVDPEYRGHVGRMADQWLEWGHAQGLL